ncbi:MAG: hypothetical protein R6V50_03065 [Thermoplasmatota archaeon]
MKVNTKIIMGFAILVCAFLLISPVSTAGFLHRHAIHDQLDQQTSRIEDNPSQDQTSDSQHWALLFAVGVYLNAPDQDRPSMLEAVDDLYDTLLDSPEIWKEENIQKITASDATLQNLIKGLLWLRKNARSDDYVLVYITTHGGHLYHPLTGQPWDMPPKDEANGVDEILVMYNGFTNWYGFIWDDLLNFFLSIIRCEALCLIVDSCYSGGFDDYPYRFNTLGRKNDVTLTAESFVEGFVESVARKGRVILMSSEEDQLTYGSFFSEFLTLGFAGYGDDWGNNDGINSAQEAFGFAKPWVELFVYVYTGQTQTPVMLDLYGEELPITMT